MLFSPVFPLTQDQTVGSSPGRTPSSATAPLLLGALCDLCVEISMFVSHINSSFSHFYANAGVYTNYSHSGTHCSALATSSHVTQSNLCVLLLSSSQKRKVPSLVFNGLPTLLHLGGGSRGASVRDFSFR